MGPNSFRNLTYAAVLAVVGALVYLVYQSSRNKQRHNASVENSTLSSYNDTLGSIAGTSSAALTNDSVRSSQDGTFATGSSGSSINSALSSSETTTSSPASSSEVKEVTVEEPAASLSSSSLTDESIASSEKTVVTAKGIKSSSTKTSSAPKVKFDAGVASGEYMAIAGSFASKDNAEALVAKLKKMGFKYAEAIKMENSANTYTVAGYYKFKGGAEAAVRTLKANKIPAIAKKKTGDIYKSTPVAPVKPVATPKSVTTTKAKPI